jgi:dimeric dUTPase (all-alpha-NTP-PPase superfamily)
MSQRQDTLNEISCKGWLNKGLNYRRALRLEAAEAMESTPWKWWKFGDLDISNLKIEAIDMIHFGLSVCLMDGYEGWKWLDDQVKTLLETPLNVPSDKRVQEMQEVLDKIMFMSFDAANSSFGPSDLIIEISRFMWLLGMSRDDMFKLYFGKNILNEFRQNNGYKAATYKKIWDGKEDNVFMQRVVSDLEISDHYDADLYDALDKKYKEVTAGGM